MKMCVWVGNLFWGMRFTRSLPYCFVNRRLVLFPCNMANFVQSHTAITSIVFYAIQKQNRGNLAPFRHCEIRNANRGNPNQNLTQKDKKC